MTLTNPATGTTDTFSGVDISTLGTIYSYTVPTTGKYKFLPMMTNAAGNGDYVIYASHQWLGSGSTAITPKSTFTFASGDTVLEFPTIEIDLLATDVFKIIATGQAGDGSVNGNIRITYDNPSVLQATDIISDGSAFPGAYIDVAISSVGGGAGATTYTVTVNDQDTNPIDGVDCWVSTDSTGTNVIARGDTDDSGQVTFYLDTGTYYLWRQLAGYTFTNPVTITV